jgi:hypothetical protein
VLKNDFEGVGGAILIQKPPAGATLIRMARFLIKLLRTRLLRSTFSTLSTQSGGRRPNYSAPQDSCHSITSSAVAFNVSGMVRPHYRLSGCNGL